jgi:cellulose synthase/poly-beta-1,6-N-acetylglucosamine synthase-like glycosyltransferase
VVIPTYNAAKVLPHCLAALEHQSIPRERLDIIVVDDGSTDGTLDVAREYGARVVCQEHSNQSAARNKGAAAAMGEIVLFTDADCVPAANWVESMIRPFDDPQVVGVKGRYRTKQPGILPRFIQQEYEEKYRRLARSTDIDFVDSYSAGYRRKVLLDIDGFDPSFPAVEDIELSFRISSKGYRLVFAQDAVVYHRHRESYREYFRKKLWVASWWVAVYRRHPEKVGNDSRQPRVLLAQIGLAGLLVAALPLLPFSSQIRKLYALGLLAFGTTTLPVAVRSAMDDPMLGLAVPPLTFWRATSQAFGILEGGIGRFTGKSRTWT